MTIPLNGIGTLNNNFRTRMEYFGTVRGRIGYAWDRTLVYATGGLAYADIESSAEFFGPAGQLQFAGNNRRTEAGYTVGAAIADERTSSDRQRGSLMPPVPVAIYPAPRQNAASDIWRATSQVNAARSTQGSQMCRVMPRPHARSSTQFLSVLSKSVSRSPSMRTSGKPLRRR